MPCYIVSQIYRTKLLWFAYYTDLTYFGECGKISSMYLVSVLSECVCVFCQKKNHIPLVWAWQRGLFSWCFHLGQAVNCFWWPSRGLGLESGRSWPRGPEASPRTTPFLCQNDFFIVTAAVFFFWPCSGLDGKAGTRRPGGRGVGLLNVLLMYVYEYTLLFDTIFCGWRDGVLVPLTRPVFKVQGSILAPFPWSFRTPPCGEANVGDASTDLCVHRFERQWAFAVTRITSTWSVT